MGAVDQHGFVTYANPAFQQLLGSIHAHDSGTVLWELVHPDDVAPLRSALDTLFRSHGAMHVEFRLQAEDGRWHGLDSTLHLVADGEDREVVVVATDSSDRQRLEASVAERDEQLRQARKMEVVGRLAGGIAHDFGNLLTVIGGASHKLIDALPPSSPLRTAAETIEASSDRAAWLVRQLLAFTRPRRDERDVIDLNAIVLQSEQLLGRLVGEHIELRTRRSSDLWPVCADRTQVEQVLLNLAVNARDAMPSGGRLTIETLNLVRADAHAFQADFQGDAVAIRVTDTGIGMDADTRQRAFDPFFTTKSPDRGTGLGLATVHAIAVAHGGWAHIASEPGRGTAVTTAFPRSYASTAEAARPALEPELSRGTEALLVVEDEAGVRELVCDFLRSAGYRVQEASGPAAAEAISGPVPVDLLLTDVVMPGMSGVDLAARLRTRWPELRVVYMSGFPEPMVGDGTLTDVGPHFVSKPFNRATLLSVVRRALDA